MNTVSAAERAAKRADSSIHTAARKAGTAAESLQAAEESVSLRILRRPEQLRRALFRLQERHSACWERCIRTGQNNDGERVSASRNIRKGEDTLAVLADTEQKLLETREALAAAMDTAEALLKRLESMPGIRSYRDALLLRLRYLDGLNWPEVCAALRRNGFPSTLRNLFFWRDAALKQLDCLLAESKSPPF